MNYTIEEISFLSSNKINTVKGKIYIPNNLEEVKGVVQIVHGMCEYFERYTNFIEFLLNNNYIVCGHDNIGHGHSVNTKDDYGYFADKLGYKCLIKDTYKLTEIVKEKFPKYKYIILGHSMGSFIVRCYMYDYQDNIDAVILSGTIGPIRFINTIIKMIDRIIDVKGARYKSKNIMKLAYRFSNVNIKHSINKFAWVSRDVRVIKKYNKDKMGNFLFTASGYKDLLKLIQYANNTTYIKKINKKLPIYIFSGEKDPIGGNTKGVTKVYDTFKKYKCNATLKIYPNGRHEMLNEINYNRVYADILAWMRNNIENGGKSKS